MISLFDFDESKRGLWSIAIYLLALGIGIIDYLSGPDIAFSLIYLIPVSLAAWCTSRYTAAVTAVMSAVSWLLADFFTARFTPNVFIYSWNFTSNLILLLIVVFLLSSFRRALLQERELSRTDHLTHALNSRSFYELADLEMGRSRRYKHPLTIVYIDVDNFKAINDTLGHSTGDQLLATIVMTLQSNIRKSDRIARLGGDEFAVLLPETSQEAARLVVAKFQHCLKAMVERNHWSVSFSIGVLTCITMPSCVNKLVEHADNIMYSVKNSGKNSVKFSIYAG